MSDDSDESDATLDADDWEWPTAESSDDAGGTARDTGGDGTDADSVGGGADGTTAPESFAGPRHLAPLSVPYRIARRGVGTLLTVLFIGITGASAIGGPLGPLVVVALVGVVALALVGYEVAYYQRFEYELTADSLDVHSGVFARRDREIPLRRVQNVDVTRSAVQRVLGLAAVNVETAGGSETEGSLRYVDAEEAARLQDEVARLKRRLAAAASESETATEAEPAAPDEEVLFELTPEELLLVGALSFDIRLPGALVLLVSGIAPTMIPDPTAFPSALLVGAVVAFLLALLAVSWGASAASAVVNYYGFRLTRVGDDLRYERGLFRRYDGTIPLEKIQTLTVEDNPLKRRFGYATLNVETAGYAPGSRSGGGTQSATAVPLATTDRILSLANEIQPFGDPALSRPPKRVRRRYVVRYGLLVVGLTGVLFAVNELVRSIPWFVALVAVPLVAVLAHYVWVHRGYWLGPDHVVTRNGFFRRETKIVAYDRVQTVIDSRTLFQRRWSVATVTVDTAGSLSIVGQDAAAVDVDEAVAGELREELLVRLRRALAGD
jgi:putative membrane protein